MLCCAGPADPALQALPLFIEPFLLMHPPGQGGGAPAAMPRAEELLLLEEGHCLRDQTLAACGIPGPAGTRHATGLEMLRHMVAAGEGISLMPGIAAHALGPVPELLDYAPMPEEAVREVVLLIRARDPREEALHGLAALIRQVTPAPARPC